jgi:hypothetical protein
VGLVPAELVFGEIKNGANAPFFTGKKKITSFLQRPERQPVQQPERRLGQQPEQRPEQPERRLGQQPEQQPEQPGPERQQEPVPERQQPALLSYRKRSERWQTGQRRE